MTPLPRPIDLAMMQHERRRRAQLPPRDVLTEDEALLIVRRAELERAQEKIGAAIEKATQP